MRRVRQLSVTSIRTRSSGGQHRILYATLRNLGTPVTLKTFCGLAAVILLANTAYIAAAASPTVFYMSNVLAHVVLGAVVWLTALAVLARDLSRRSPLAEADREFSRNPFVVVAFITLTVAAAFAVELIRRGNLLELRWVLISHVVAGAIATAALLPLAWRVARTAGVARQFGAAYQLAAVLVVVVPLASLMWSRTHPNPDDRIVNPSMAP